MPYISFRKALRDISYKMLSREFKDIQYLPANSPFFCYPIDEDDWVCEGIAEIIYKAYQPHSKIYRWPHAMYSLDSFRIVKEKIHACNSNNYVLTAPFSNKQLLKHGHATRLYNECKEKVEIPHVLSLHNKNLSSLSLYHGGFCKKDMIRYYHRCKSPKNLPPPKFRKAHSELMNLYDDLMLR
jgi:hypothetical protein